MGRAPRLIIAMLQLGATSIRVIKQFMAMRTTSDVGCSRQIFRPSRTLPIGMLRRTGSWAIEISVARSDKEGRMSCDSRALRKLFTAAAKLECWPGNMELNVIESENFFLLSILLSYILAISGTMVFSEGMNGLVREIPWVKKARLSLSDEEDEWFRFIGGGLSIYKNIFEFKL